MGNNVRGYGGYCDWAYHGDRPENAVLCAKANDATSTCEGPGILWYGSAGYGANIYQRKFVKKGETALCSNSAVGCDSVPGYPKECYIQSLQTTPGLSCDDSVILYDTPQAWDCGSESEKDTCEGPGIVYYGSDEWGDTEVWAMKFVPEGESIDCTNSAFDCDPLPGYPKKCKIEPKQTYGSVGFMGRGDAECLSGASAGAAPFEIIIYGASWTSMIQFVLVAWGLLCALAGTVWCLKQSWLRMNTGATQYAKVVYESESEAQELQA